MSKDYDIDQELLRFVSHMQKGLAGVEFPEAMRMIPTYVSLSDEVSVREPVIVMDAGGTNFRICLLSFDENNKYKIEHFKKYKMPGADSQISKDQFYETIAKYLLPYLEFSNRVGFVFSFECEIQPNLDGRIINMSKENQADDIVDTFISQNINQKLKELGYLGEAHIIIVNDTVTALLSGVSQKSDISFDSYAGLILGTGINSSYIEQNSNILKIGNKIDSTGNMVINMESGNYFIQKESDIDQEIELSTTVPGDHALEKLISGRYQGLQVLYILKHAIEEEEFFSESFAHAMKALDNLESYDLDQFLFSPNGNNILAKACQNEDDQIYLYYIIDNVFERAAKLTAMVICGIHIQTNSGRNPLKPLAITIEGTTYYKSKLFKKKLDYFIKDFINEKHGFYNHILQIDEANIIGAAMASLMN